MKTIIFPILLFILFFIVLGTALAKEKVNPYPDWAGELKQPLREGHEFYFMKCNEKDIGNNLFQMSFAIFSRKENNIQPWTYSPKDKGNRIKKKGGLKPASIAKACKKYGYCENDIQEKFEIIQNSICGEIPESQQYKLFLWTNKRSSHRIIVKFFTLGWINRSTGEIFWGVKNKEQFGSFRLMYKVGSGRVVPYAYTCFTFFGESTGYTYIKVNDMRLKPRGGCRNQRSPFIHIDSATVSNNSTYEGSSTEKIEKTDEPISEIVLQKRLTVNSKTYFFHNLFGYVKENQKTPIPQQAQFSSSRRIQKGLFVFHLVENSLEEKTRAVISPIYCSNECMFYQPENVEFSLLLHKNEVNDIEFLFEIENQKTKELKITGKSYMEGGNDVYYLFGNKIQEKKDLEKIFLKEYEKLTPLKITTELGQLATWDEEVQYITIPFYHFPKKIFYFKGEALRGKKTQHKILKKETEIFNAEGKIIIDLPRKTNHRIWVILDDWKGNEYSKIFREFKNSGRLDNYLNITSVQARFDRIQGSKTIRDPGSQIKSNSASKVRADLSYALRSLSSHIDPAENAQEWEIHLFVASNTQAIEKDEIGFIQNKLEKMGVKRIVLWEFLNTVLSPEEDTSYENFVKKLKFKKKYYFIDTNSKYEQTLLNGPISIF